MDNFKITPLFSMDAEQLQELTAPTGKFTCDSPKGASDAKIVSGENTRRDDRGDGRQNLINQACLNCCHDMNVASELRRFETRVANHTPYKFIFGVIIHKNNG